MKKELLQYASLAKFLKDALGERYRIALIDADDTSREIDVSERGFEENVMIDPANVGILSDIINGIELKKRDYLCAFSDSGSENNSAEEKNSVFYIRNEAGEISGFLCIYEQRGDLYMVHEVLDQILLPEEQAANGSKRIEDEVNALLKEKITDVWNRHKALNNKMKKAEKIAFISELFEMGIFRMKGSAIHISEITGISPASIYRYLNEVVEQ